MIAMLIFYRMSLDIYPLLSSPLRENHNQTLTFLERMVEEDREELLINPNKAILFLTPYSTLLEWSKTVVVSDCLLGLAVVSMFLSRFCRKHEKKKAEN